MTCNVSTAARICEFGIADLSVLPSSQPSQTQRLAALTSLIIKLACGFAAGVARTRLEPKPPEKDASSEVIPPDPPGFTAFIGHVPDRSNGWISVATVRVKHLLSSNRHVASP